MSYQKFSKLKMWSLYNFKLVSVLSLPDNLADVSSGVYVESKKMIGVSFPDVIRFYSLYKKELVTEVPTACFTVYPYNSLYLANKCLLVAKVGDRNLKVWRHNLITN